jgi:cytochrome c2
MIAGALPNSPDNLTRYLLSPESVVKGNVMPNQHLTGGDARDAAAYLLTLR